MSFARLMGARMADTRVFYAKKVANEALRVLKPSETFLRPCARQEA